MLRLTIVDGEAARENAKTWARPFTARLLEPGLVSYEDRGCGIALLKKETIDRDIHSFIGRPVVIKHTKTSPRNMKEVGHGYLTDVFYNVADGWWYGRGVVDTDEAADEINRVGFGSVGYGVTRTGSGGVWHDMSFSEEILGFSGEHLAIVGRPRYEEATIRLNSKVTTKSNKIMFKFWKKSPASSVKTSEATTAKADETKPADDAASRENASAASEISPDSEIEVTGADGKTSKVTLGALIESHTTLENSKKNGVDCEEDSEVTHNGKTYKLNALIEAFDKWETHRANESEKDKERENAKPADKPAVTATTEPARENGKAQTDHFRVLLNASAKPATTQAPRDFNSQDERLARGAKMFGSGKN